MNCQWYGKADIGKPKVIALREQIEQMTGTQIATINDKFEGAPMMKSLGGPPAGLLRGIVISAVDSMEARKTIWKAVKDNHRTQWFIDPRMAAEYALTFVMNPNDPKDQASYEKTLYTDENAVQERCTAKATMYTATMIAGYVAKHVKDLVTKNPYARVTHWNIATNVMQNWSKT